MIKRLIPAMFLPLLAITSANAIEIRTIRYNHAMIFVVDGIIEIGDSEKFKKAWEEEAYDAFEYTVALDSPGGSLGEGIELGEFFRENNVTTIVAKYSSKPPLQDEGEYSSNAVQIPNAECFSACALAFMGGVERTVDEDSKIGFHQFSGKDGNKNLYSNSQLETNTQSVSALVSSYLRRMGAKQELFEIMSSTPPNDMYVLSRTQLTDLEVTPSDKFKNFTLKPKSGEIVANAINPRSSRGMQKLHEIDFFCWKGKPTINFYAKTANEGLSPEQISFTDGGWSIFTDAITFEFGSNTAKLYPNQRILATLTLDKKTARKIIKGNFSVSVNSMTANGFFLGGHIEAPEGDEAILASLKSCL